MSQGCSGAGEIEIVAPQLEKLELRTCLPKLSVELYRQYRMATEMFGGTVGTQWVVVGPEFKA